jgi:hypothetical protein
MSLKDQWKKDSTIRIYGEDGKPESIGGEEPTKGEDKDPLQTSVDKLYGTKKGLEKSLYSYLKKKGGS